MRVALLVEYDGTNYCGWQRQENGDTIQQQLEQALCAIVGEPVRIHGAGRTDAGVHALGQVAHFDVQCGIPPDKFSYALNQALPRDISVVRSWKAAEGFHARFSAKGKHYRYIICNRTQRSALWENRAMYVARPLDVQQMKQAAQCFLGTHDFAAFCAAHSSVVDTVRTIQSIEIRVDDYLLIIDIKGNGFLYNMVRIIAGTLIEVGLMKRNVETILPLLERGDRALAGATAHACGLYMVEVYY